MKYYRFVFLLIPFILFSIRTSPQTVTANEDLTLSHCLKIAMDNPVLRAAEAEVAAAKARVVQAGSLQQPELSLDSDLQPQLFSFRKSGEAYWGISQTLEWPGKLILRSGIARHEARESGLDRDRIRWELILEVKRAFYSLLLAGEQWRLSKENMDLAGDFFQRAKVKYESGDAPQIEMMKARVESARAENEEKLTGNQYRVAMAALNFYLGWPPDRSLKIRGELKPRPVDLTGVDIRQEALQKRPEIQQARVAVKRARLQSREARMGYLPDLGLGVARHRITGEETTWDVTLALQVPLFFWQRAKGEIAEAKAGMDRARAELEQAERSVLLEVETAYRNAEAMRQQIRFFEDQVLHEAEEVYEKTMFSYQEGEVGYIELIESRRTLIQTKKDYTDTLFQYRAALSELERALGRPLTEEYDD